MRSRRPVLDEARIRLQVRLVLTTVQSAMDNVRRLPIPVQDRRDRLSDIRRRAHEVLDETSEIAAAIYPELLWEIDDVRAQVNTAPDV